MIPGGRSHAKTYFSVTGGVLGTRFASRGRASTLAFFTTCEIVMLVGMNGLVAGFSQTPRPGVALGSSSNEGLFSREESADSVRGGAVHARTATAASATARTSTAGIPPGTRFWRVSHMVQR